MVLARAVVSDRRPCSSAPLKGAAASSDSVRRAVPLPITPLTTTCGSAAGAVRGVAAGLDGGRAAGVERPLAPDSADVVAVGPDVGTDRDEEEAVGTASVVKE